MSKAFRVSLGPYSIPMGQSCHQRTPPRTLEHRCNRWQWTNQANSHVRPEPEPSLIIPIEYESTPPAAYSSSPIAPVINPGLSKIIGISKVMNFHAKSGLVVSLEVWSDCLELLGMVLNWKTPNCPWARLQFICFSPKYKFQSACQILADTDQNESKHKILSNTD